LKAIAGHQRHFIRQANTPAFFVEKANYLNGIGAGYQSGKYPHTAEINIAHRSLAKADKQQKSQTPG
jgi:hypothetical protein